MGQVGEEGADFTLDSCGWGVASIGTGAVQTFVRGELGMIGYCMKCRSESEMAETRSVTMRNGRPATEGKCPKCNTRMYRLGKV